MLARQEPSCLHWWQAVVMRRQPPARLGTSGSEEEKMLILHNRLNHYLNSHQLRARGGLGSKAQMAAVAKSFPEQEEIGVNSRLCN